MQLASAYPRPCDPRRELFLWDKTEDRKIMKGEADFEFRIRDAPLAEASLKNQCNPDWRDIVYG